MAGLKPILITCLLKKKDKLCLLPGHSTFVVQVLEVSIFHPLLSTHIDGVALWGFQ